MSKNHAGTPQPGSDEINRAYEEGWVENHALAFIGDTLFAKGRESAGAGLSLSYRKMKLAGSSLAVMRRWLVTEQPCPRHRRGVSQRRLTFTHHRPFYPGLVNVPRHWARCNPQGTQIAFLMRDDNGIVQLWLISAQGRRAAPVNP
ncbi:hypothetical protein MJK71_28310 [Escherichia coli]|nr:hypothetical protein MJK71_28310 [Escherichia coli]